MMALSAVRSLKNVNMATRLFGFSALRQMPQNLKQVDAEMNQGLKEVDPQMYDIIQHEKKRQLESIVLIPSENFTSQAVLDALGSVMQNKYSEGYPGARYYGGNEYIDMSESLCIDRALNAFGLDKSKWGVNVQSLSGAPANLYVYGALIKPHDRIMGLDLPHGGHLSHGYQTPTKKISFVSVYYETFPYRLNEETGYINYEALEKSAEVIRPKIIIAGASAYPRHYEYKTMRKICDNVGAYLVSDMAHIGGLVAAGVVPSPFEHSDIVTTTTHKSLRGPRGAMIFYRKGVRNVDSKGKEVLYDLEEKINSSVFPGHQGGPHNHTIAALAVALKQAQTPAYKEYQKQVLSNNKRFAETFVKLGYKLVSGGTENHLLLIDLKKNGIDGARAERVLELANIACNKNTVPGDKSALIPGGLRMGTPAVTTRGANENDMETIANFVHRAINIAVEVNNQVGAGKKLKDFKDLLQDGQNFPAIGALKKDVIAFSSKFPAIGQKNF